MLSELLIGSALIGVTVVIQAAFISFAANGLTHFGSWLGTPPTMARSIVSLAILVIWLVIGVTINVWLWVFVFLFLGALENVSNALYFSIVTFTTLGYGDITLKEGYQILSSMCGVNGLVIFGLNTAFTFEYFVRLRDA